VSKCVPGTTPFDTISGGISVIGVRKSAPILGDHYEAVIRELGASVEGDEDGGRSSRADARVATMKGRVDE
jgi:hypothetical protein